MLKSAIFTVLLILNFVSFAQEKYDPKKYITFFEQSDFLESPKYDISIDYCKKLEKGSKWIKYYSFGKSAENRDLPLLVLSKENAFTPDQVKKSKKALVMIQCGIHAGEIDGKDAMLMLARDICLSKKYAGLLDNLNIMIIPIYNVDGHERISPYNRINQDGPKEMGWRVTSTNLNLNRDYLKADAIETKYWLKLFNTWLPDFFVDCHVTDGADYPYEVTYEVETNENIDKGIADWTKNKFLPFVLNEMEKSNHPIAPYAYPKDEFDMSKGWLTGITTPRLSTGYAAIQNRQGFLIETHSYKNYKTRVFATYDLVRIILDYINKDYSNLKELNQKADKTCEEFFTLKKSLPVSFASTDKSEIFHFKGYKLVKEYSKISESYSRSYEKEIVTADIPYYSEAKITKSIEAPFAYIIPKAWSEIANMLMFHGIKVGQLLEDKNIEIEQYKLSNPKWRERPNEGRHPVSYKIDVIKNKITFPKGSFFVPVDQRTARIIMHLLEPGSNESYVSWGFFDAIFEQKEYGEDYVLEKLAKKMLNENKDLQKEFDEKVKSDTLFAKNPHERLNFFYKNSPYWDSNLGIYPIVRVNNKFNFTK